MDKTLIHPRWTDVILLAAEHGGDTSRLAGGRGMALAGFRWPTPTNIARSRAWEEAVKAKIPDAEFTHLYDYAGGGTVSCVYVLK